MVLSKSKKDSAVFFLFCFVFSRHRPPPRLPREEQSRPPALPTSFHLKKNMDARTYILSLFHLGSSTGQWHCFNITAKNVIPRRRGESGCSGALGQQAWDRVWMVEIRTKELLPFFFLLFFFLHVTLCTLPSGQRETFQSLSNRNALSRCRKGSRKKFQLRDESALRFLLCPALQISLTSSSVSICAHFFYPVLFHVSRMQTQL